MARSRDEHIIQVWNKPHTVTVYQKSKAVWVASGTYNGENIETKGATRSAALKAWGEAARYKGN